MENNFRREYWSRPEVKKRRKHCERTKINEGVREGGKQISLGTYKSGVEICAQEHAKKIVKKLMEKSKHKQNILADKTCKYYPDFCKEKGHTSAACKACAMYGTSKEEKDDAMKQIRNRFMAEQIEIAKNTGKPLFDNCCVTHDNAIFMIWPIL